jgi:cytochrome c oxidase subunit 3
MLNTAALVAASVAVEWAAQSARRGNVAVTRKALAVVGALSLAFIAGQVAVWSQLRDAGFLVATSAATGFFYLLTAAHGAHVIGGLVGWVRTMLRAWRGVDPARTRLAVEMCAIYWHFLLIAWIVLFAVLASNRLGLAICGPNPL